MLFKCSKVFLMTDKGVVGRRTCRAVVKALGTKSLSEHDKYASRDQPSY